MTANESLSIPKFAAKAEIEELLLSLPRNLHWDKQKKRESSEQDGALSAALDILEEGDEEEEKAEEGLDIAWQYRKSVQQKRLAQPLSQTKPASIPTNVFCHSYDLSGRMNDQSSIDLSKY